MKIQPRQFARAYVSACEDKTPKQIEEVTKLFLKNIRATHAWKLIPSILSHIQKYADEKDEVMPVTISSVHALDAHTTKAIVKTLGFKNVRITEQIAPEILGGFIARTADMICDGSLKTQLNQLKRHLQS